ncbi:MAG: betaine/proline/choline family ABC transporter ATP-binding protein [Pseudomonadota bacterium]
MTPMLSCRALWKVFGATDAAFSALTDAERASPEAVAAKGWIGAVRNASFDIARGEVFVIMGLSGSGKSTLVRCLSRLIEPTQGSVTIDGQDLLAANERDLIALRRRLMSMVFQHFALLPNRSVLGNVAFPLQIHGTDRRAREDRARQMIELVGLSGREDHFPNELSGGQQQRVGIARSLASDPAVWFLDEPFSALDPLIRADLQDELLRLQRQLHKTIIFITHDLDEAIKIADRIAIMENGQIVQIGRPDELVLSPATEYVARFVRDVPKAKVIRVRHIMETGSASAGTNVQVAADNTVDAVAKKVIAAGQPVAVVDDAGAVVGLLRQDTVVKVLAGLPHGIEMAPGERGAV